MAPLLLLLLLLLLPPLTSASSFAMDSETSLLLSIKESLSAPLKGWDLHSNADHCHWPGVTCDPTSGRVSGLNLTALTPSPLAGPISPAFANFTALCSLSLKGNSFYGEIPDAITNLSHLRLIDFSFNALSGTIPAKLVGMGSLQSLDLSFNKLSGNIKMGSDCRNVHFLALSGNLLIGNIPPEIGTCVSLKALLLDRNILTGRIPAEIGLLEALLVLDVSGNSLTDRIPAAIGHCRNLSVLVLTICNGNAHEFNAFVGGIPPRILDIPTLKVLWAPRSNLHGRLVKSSDKSCGLRVLNLGQNHLTDEIPQWLASCRDLEFLDLSSNHLEGALPEGLAVGCMNYFNISRNSLHSIRSL